MSRTAIENGHGLVVLQQPLAIAVVDGAPGAFVHGHAVATRAEARLRIAPWITDFYNTRRRHSKTGGRPLVEFESLMRETRKAHQARYGHQEAPSRIAKPSTLRAD